MACLCSVCGEGQSNLHRPSGQSGKGSRNSRQQKAPHFVSSARGFLRHFVCKQSRPASTYLQVGFNGGAQRYRLQEKMNVFRGMEAGYQQEEVLSGTARTLRQAYSRSATTRGCASYEALVVSGVLAVAD